MGSGDRRHGPLDLSHLETLVIAQSSISEKDVPFLLTRAKNLKNLHLGLTHEWEAQPFYEHSDCLVEGLLSIKDTVEKISISLECHPCTDAGSDEDFQMEESREVLHGIFAQFPRLRTLKASVALLFGFDADQTNLGDCSVLPETLDDLVLRIEFDEIYGFCWGTPDTDGFVMSILYNLHGSFPHLRSNITRAQTILHAVASGRRSENALNL